MQNDIAKGVPAVHEGLLADHLLKATPLHDPSPAQTVSRILAAQQIKKDKGSLMTEQAFTVLMAVAERPGKTMQELHKECGLSVNSISRNLMSLGEWHRNKIKGLELVETADDPHERRRMIAFLTPKGVSFVRSYLSALTGKPSNFTAPTAKEFLSRTYSSNIR